MGALSEIREGTVAEIEESSPGPLAGAWEKEMMEDRERWLEFGV